MQIKLSSVMVDDQEKALAFYTTVLGFEKKADIPDGSELPLADRDLTGRPGRGRAGAGTH